MRIPVRMSSQNSISFNIVPHLGSVGYNASDAALTAASHVWNGTGFAEATQFFLGETQG